MAISPSALVPVGEILGPHGVRGQVRVRSFTGTPGALVRRGPLSDPGGRRRLVLSLTGAGRDARTFLASVAGVTDRDGAVALAGTLLCIERERLGEIRENEDGDTCLVVDLIGLAAREQETGRTLGEVVQVANFGASDCLEIAPSGGGESFWLPFTREIFTDISYRDGFLVVSLPPGAGQPSSPDGPGDRPAGENRPGKAQAGGGTPPGKAQAGGGKPPGKARAGGGKPPGKARAGEGTPPPPPPFLATVLTLFPEMFPGPLAHSLAGRALERGLWALETIDIRDFAGNPHGSVDDTPCGGGAGMLMAPGPVAGAVDRARETGDRRRPAWFLSPAGRPFCQQDAGTLVARGGVILLCGRYEGIDHRVIGARGLEEISLGDYILSGGELAALSVIDAAVRLLPGVMGRPSALCEESFSDILLEYPQYTRPRIWEGHEVPAILLSGDHARISAARRLWAEERTARQRPDLWRAWLARAGAQPGRTITNPGPVPPEHQDRQECTSSDSSRPSRSKN